MTPEELYEVLQKYARSKGMELNPDSAYTFDIIMGLQANEERFGYRSCPCRLAVGDERKDRDIRCPCLYCEPDVTEHKSCYCSLFVSKDVYEGEAALTAVPERRPAEKRP